MRLTATQPDSDDSVAVFLQPTNALVNQTFSSFCVDKGIVGEVDPITGKREYMHKLAMFTGECRYNTDMKYKVLVTNPECLEILLLEASLKENEKRLSERLGYVVFDEIHSVSSAGQLN